MFLGQVKVGGDDVFLRQQRDLRFGCVIVRTDVAQQIAWEQLMEYRRDANVKPEAYAWELVWDHGK